MQAIRQRRDEDDGFTLIELMVVVLIIAILLAIAIPSFMGAKARASERRSQGGLRNALTAARTLATDLGQYAFQVGSVDNPLDATKMQAAEPAYTFTDVAANADVKTIAVFVDEDPAYPVPNTRIHLVTVAGSGRWFGLTSTTRGNVHYCSGPTVAAVDEPGECTADKW